MPNSRPTSATHTNLRTRAIAGCAALGALGVLSLAAYLRPASEGYGTHEQLGMLPCTWAAVLDRPCPTCGMTTSFAHAANGSLLASFTAQPFGALLALLTASAFWGGMHVCVTGSRLGRIYALLLRQRSLWILGAILLVAWGYKLATWPGASG